MAQRTRLGEAEVLALVEIAEAMTSLHRADGAGGSRAEWEARWQAHARAADRLERLAARLRAEVERSRGRTPRGGVR